jgi:chromosome segregation ATPase
MTNKNKNSKKLVARTDDNPTVEIDIPESTGNPRREFEPEIEVDAQTFDMDNLGQESNGGSRADLEAAFHEQANLVEELRFEVEQLSSRKRGLEEELRARQEIADNIKSEVAESRFQLGEALRKLESRGEEFRSTKAALDKANSLNDRLGDQAAGLKIAAKEFKRKIKSLESVIATNEKQVITLETELRKKRTPTNKSARPDQMSDIEASALKIELASTRADLADLRNYVVARKDKWASLEAELAEARDQLDAQRKETEQLRLETDERNSQLVRSREQYINASQKLSQQKAKSRKLSKINRELDRKLHHDAEVEIAACQARIAKQSGELAARLHELKCLRKDNARIERYSDALRIQLQDRVSISKVSDAIRHKLETGLDATNATIDKLSDELNTAQQLNDTHAHTIESLHKKFEEEIRLVRLELGAAQETLAGQESLNEELTSDLIDNQGYRQALESQLNEVEEKKEKTILELTVQLGRATEDAESYERKLRVKDRAIADLMQELENHSSKIESSGDISSVLQKIDGFRTAKGGAGDQYERDPIARLLIGRPDGRELRFPLFKKRLTIGRTSHNDIQLNMQYVSRRHAVISTDQGKTRVIDWGSKNGVFVNNRKVTEKILESGDLVSIGMADFKYEERTKRADLKVTDIRPT